MGSPANVKMGVCNVMFGTHDLGYTKGNVSVKYSAESIEKTVDQEDVPIDEIISKQTFEVEVPMAEYDLERFSLILPGATLVTDGTNPTKKKLSLDGAASGSLLTKAQKLVITPIGGTANDAITVFYAVPVPTLEFAFEKENIRVFKVTFKAMAGVLGWVTFGDTTAVA